MTKINQSKTSARTLLGLQLWELRRVDPIAYRDELLARVTNKCRNRSEGRTFDCGQCFSYPDFDGLITVTCHFADCPDHGQQADQ